MKKILKAKSICWVLLAAQGIQVSTASLERNTESFKQKLEHDYNLVAANIPEFREKYSQREFQENYKAIQSRMFGLNRSDGTKV